MELFMYRCDICGSIKLTEEDFNDSWYSDCYGICVLNTFHDKIIIVNGSAGYGFKRKKDEVDVSKKEN
jgi:hypothetical protein